MKINIVAIKSNLGYYISDNPKGESYHSSKIASCLYNSLPPEKTFDKDWYFVKGNIDKVSYIKKGEQINHRYEIIDKSFVNENVKEVYLREEIAHYNEHQRLWFFNEEYKHLKPLFNERYDMAEDVEEDVDFTIDTILEVEEIKTPTQLSYKAQVGDYRHNGMGFITDKAIIHQLMDRLIFPSILIPEKPCKLSSYSSYKIVREYVKENINPEYAIITSDYDFCFTVKKKIYLDEVRSYTVDVNNDFFGKRKRKPKIETRFQKNREVEIFEMTSLEEHYKGYTPIKGFEGTSHDNLIDNIEVYLKNLIEEINKPLSDCPHCKGLGVLEITKIPTNK